MYVSHAQLLLFLCQVCGGDLPYVAPDSLLEKHNFFKCEAVHRFNSIKKMGGKDFCASYQVRLEVELDELWESYSKHNDVSIRDIKIFSKKLFYTDICSWYIFLLFSVKECFQCIPHTSSAFCPGLSLVCSLCGFIVRRPKHCFIRM